MKEKELKKLNVGDVLAMKEYREEMKKVMLSEEQLVRKATNMALYNRAHLCRTSVDRMKEKGVWDVENMTASFSLVMQKKLIGFSKAERDYIYLIGCTAFRQTMKRLGVEKIGVS